MVDLVKMESVGKLADVHPNEVEMMESYGWKIIDANETSNNLYNVFKVVDGEVAENPSKRGMTLDDANDWIAEHPNAEYTVQEV